LIYRSDERQSIVIRVNLSSEAIVEALCLPIQALAPGLDCTRAIPLLALLSL
jgi:hypothetical protein